MSNHYISSYGQCPELGKNEEFDVAVENRVEELTDDLVPGMIKEALIEVPEDSWLWVYMYRVFEDIHEKNDTLLDNASALAANLLSAVEHYVEKEAVRQIKCERDNPLPEPDASVDNHRSV